MCRLIKASANQALKSHKEQGLWHSAGVSWSPCQSTISQCEERRSSSGSSVEQVKRRDGGLFRLLDLRLGEFDSTHRHHSTDSKVGRHAANTQPERPVQAVIQDNEQKEPLPIIGHPLGQTVVPHRCQETQQGQGTEKSWREREVTGKEVTPRCSKEGNKE